MKCKHLSKVGKAMNIDQYLNRIKQIKQYPSFRYLKALQYAHLMEVPFENLDVIRRRPIYLNVKTIYKKIVRNNRGGYCYELNGLFQWLLNSLGFKTYLVAATVMRSSGEFAKKNTHVGIIVTLDQPYLVDVGFGHAQLQPISLDGKTYTDVSGTYKIEKYDGEFYDLLRKKDQSWRILYRFSLKKMELVDFHEGVVYNQVSEQSTFTHADLLTKPTKSGRITLKDHTLTITKHSKRTKRELTTIEKEQIIKDTFNININH